MKKLPVFLLAAGITAFLAFKPATDDPKFIDPSNMDLSVKPGDNFFLYANGGWLKKKPGARVENAMGQF